jgi:hypothetical protein
MSIKVQKFVIDEAVLDLLGNEFKFDHAKGLAEWLKNSCDAYLRESKPDDEHVIYVRLTEGKNKQLTRIECIDFVGMRKANIDDAFKRFFDPAAAKKGAKNKDQVKVLGGHGNGGKFYMRQMFKTSRAISYRDGRLSIFGFNERRQYGFEDGYEDRKAPVGEALKLAGISAIEIPDGIRSQLEKGKTGFTVIVGEHPQKAPGARRDVLIERLIVHPQARRQIEKRPISFLFNDDTKPTRVPPPKILPKEGFETPIVLDVPATIHHGGGEVEFTNVTYSWPGRLVLKTSRDPLRNNLAVLNTIDFQGEVGIIGSYRIHELGASRYSGQVEFIYGECECPILEDPDEDCVRNDRQVLIENERTRALIEWVRQQVDVLAEKMETKNAQDKKQQDLKNTSVFNEMLNKWKDRFMNQFWGEVFAGKGPAGNSGAGAGAGGSGGGDGKPSGDNKHGTGPEGGTDKKRAPKFPTVLISGEDTDPFDTLASTPFQCDERHPAVYQRPQDAQQGIYWINTARPLADKILSEYEADSTRWREYLFQRYVDIIVKESVFQLGKQSTSISADDVARRMDDVLTHVHDAAAKDLNSFLFDEAFGS